MGTAKHGARGHAQGVPGRAEESTERGYHESAAHALTVYLNDHLAGATAGVRLARRLTRHQELPEGVGELSTLLSEITRDRDTLLRLMRELDIPIKRYMLVGAVIGERVARFKPNGRMLRGSDVRDVVELEAMLLGVQGKAALWRLLGSLPEVDRGGRAEELSGLLTRADQQAETLERLREDAAVRVMAGGARPGATDH